MKNFWAGVLLITWLIPFQSLAQDAKIALTLKQVIELARSQSLSAKQAETIKENRYWQFRVYKSNYAPQMTLNGTLPNFVKAVNPVLQPNGETVPRNVHNNSVNLDLRLSQQIAATGGRLFVNTSASRFSNLIDDAILPLSYSATPMSVGFVQPIFQFNRLKWDKRVEPLRFEESKKEYIQELESISITATQLFFNQLLAQISLEIAKKNSANNDTIFKIAKGRYNLGKIAEDELLQLELTLLTSEQQVSQSNLDQESATLRLKSYIGFNDDTQIELVLPDVIPDFLVNEDVAVDEAKKNRAEFIGFQRQIIEAQRGVAQAKGTTGLSVDLFAQYGLTNSAIDYGQLYSDPSEQQRLSVGFSIPILDWGRTKSAVQTADANRKLVEFTVQQNEINFEEQIYTQVKQFDMLREQFRITQKADEVALKRYDISRNRYLIGKQDITQLNIALQEKDQAKRNYIQSLRDFWTAYYNLRALTLYDFETQTVLYKDEVFSNKL